MKNNFLKFINPILALLFLLTMIAMALYRFGPESLQGSESMGQLHAWAGTLFFLVALLHIYFNWGWIKLNIFGIKKKGKN